MDAAGRLGVNGGSSWRRRLASLLTTLALTATALTVLAAADNAPAERAAAALDSLAVSYVKLALAAGQVDADYVDAYTGPPAWAAEAAAAPRSLPSLRAEAEAHLARLAVLDRGELPPALAARERYLAAQLRALGGRLALLAGERLDFDTEARILFDATLPSYAPARGEAARCRLAALLPGEGPLRERFEVYERRYFVPREKIAAVMEAAIAECRRRTRVRIALPETESFALELVSGQPWSAYNWYQGGGKSLIQVNLDQPFRIWSAVGLAAHEGYPGHHVENLLLERELAAGRGWVEFRLSPLFSPRCVVSEGMAQFAAELAFPGDERLAFTRDVLFPLAGFDPAEAARYAEVMTLVDQELDAGADAILGRYARGELSREAAVPLLEAEALVAPGRARQNLDFVDRYRSYSVTYPAGYALVKDFVVARAGETDAAERWRVFAELLGAPVMPAGLR